MEVFHQNFDLPPVLINTYNQNNFEYPETVIMSTTISVSRINTDNPRVSITVEERMVTPNNLDCNI